MSRFRDRLLPIVAGGLVVVVALAVVLLLKSAGDQGTTALRQAKLAQVQATADSFNERVNSSLTGVKGLGQVAWQLTPNSKADERVLNSYNVDPNAQSGFFLVNSSGTITTGVLLRPGKLGSKFNPPALQQVKAELTADNAVVLPVSNNGYTTELPSYDFVVPIFDPNTKTLRGELVLEQAVTSSSSFEKEISQLAQHDPSSAAWFFIDSNGTVVASTTESGLGKPVENHAVPHRPERTFRHWSEARHCRRHSLARLAGDLPRGSFAVRRRAIRPVATGRPDPGAAAACRRPDADRHPGPAAARVARAGAAAAQPDPLAGRVHLGGLA